MEGSGVIGLFLLFILGGLGIWIFSMSLDKGRIGDYVRQRGGRVVSVSYAPFGKGWFGEKSDRIYEVVYYDRDGNLHRATCKTSLFSGVYWTEDRVTAVRDEGDEPLPASDESGVTILGSLPPAFEDEPENIDAEIARLRRRIEELERKRRDRGAFRGADDRGGLNF